MRAAACVKRWSNKAVAKRLRQAGWNPACPHQTDRIGGGAENVFKWCVLQLSLEAEIACEWNGIGAALYLALPAYPAFWKYLRQSQFHNI